MKLAEFHVIRMKEDSGMCIFARINHAILDGKGYCVFMKRWADISKHMVTIQRQQDRRDIPPIPALVIQHDRSVLQTDIEREVDALEPPLVQVFDKSTAVAKWVAWFSPELRGRIFKYLMSSPPLRNYYVHLSITAYERLVQLIQPFIEPEISHLSANDVITALATVLFAQALHKVGRLDGESVYMANVVADVRPRIKQLDEANYVGNAVIPKAAVCMLEPMATDSSPRVLASVACNIRRAVDGLDQRYCEQIGHLINKNASGYVDLVLGITKMDNTLVSTNHARFGYYQMDFGGGAPLLVRPAFLIFENDFVIMPGHPDIGGYELAFTMLPQVAKVMMASEGWRYIS
ncbi:hypothetical protein EV175_000751 [Coemansia sp. RSA 1933]|nr:hypothetical protein EV175_000751 [Coemansia sp. RSA 1933]